MTPLTIQDWLEFGQIGSVILAVIGGYYLARGFWVSKEKAVDLGTTRVAYNTPEENLKLPAVDDRIKLARDAKIGFTILATASVLQIVFIVLNRIFS